MQCSAPCKRGQVFASLTPHDEFTYSLLSLAQGQTVHVPSFPHPNSEANPVQHSLSCRARCQGRGGSAHRSQKSNSLMAPSIRVCIPGAGGSTKVTGPKGFCKPACTQFGLLGSAVTLQHSGVSGGLPPQAKGCARPTTWPSKAPC